MMKSYPLICPPAIFIRPAVIQVHFKLKRKVEKLNERMAYPIANNLIFVKLYPILLGPRALQ